MQGGAQFSLGRALFEEIKIDEKVMLNGLIFLNII